jgi:DNA-binding MarR family transcriptional regulator
VSRAARRLEDNGLVRRAPGFDGRYRIVSLSVDGKKTVRLCRPLAQRVDEQLTDSFSDREVERLVAMLEQVRRSARTPLRGSRRFS